MKNLWMNLYQIKHLGSCVYHVPLRMVESLRSLNLPGQAETVHLLFRLVRTTHVDTNTLAVCRPLPQFSTLTKTPSRTFRAVVMVGVLRVRHKKGQIRA